jgi:hypothetical protein
MYDHPFANFVPGFLQHTDLPEVMASIAPRRVTLAGTVNAKGKTMEVESARQIYAGANQGGNISMQSDAGWTVERLFSYATE